MYIQFYFYLGLLAVTVAIFPLVVVFFNSKRKTNLQRMRDEEEKAQMIDSL